MKGPSLAMQMKSMYFRPAFNQKYWSLLEAVLILRGALPNDLIRFRELYFDGKYAHVTLEELKRFDFGIDQKLYRELQKAVRAKNVPVDYAEGKIELIKPRNVVIWALFKGYILSDEIQHALGFRQQPRLDQIEKACRAVRNMTVGQYIIYYKNLTNVSKMIEDEWTKEFADFTKTTNGRGLTPVFMRLFEGGGQRGKRTQDRPFRLQPIQDVFSIDGDGTYLCSFPLLRAVIFKATDVLLHMAAEKGLKASKEKDRHIICKIILSDPIIKLYLLENKIFTSAVVLELIVERMLQG